MTTLGRRCSKAEFLDQCHKKGCTLFTPVLSFGVIPKGHASGKWRLIVDLSSPKGASVNDGIDPLWCTLTYISVDDVAKIIAGMGKGTLLAKMDLKALTEWCQFTQKTDGCWGCSGGIRST